VPRAQIRGAKLSGAYRVQWFDPRNGSWRNAGSGIARSNQIGIIELPDFPADTDWGLRLMYENVPSLLKPASRSECCHSRGVRIRNPQSMFHPSRHSEPPTRTHKWAMAFWPSRLVRSTRTM
jgi:hypothetical protein